MAEPTYGYLRPHLEDGVLVLTITRTQLQGEEVAAELRQEMLQTAEHFQARNVVVDFTKTDYLSSCAFWPLISLWRKVNQVGGRLVLCGLSPMVGDVFYTTRLVSPDGSFAAPFGMEKDVAAAVARAKEERPPEPAAPG